MSPHVQAAVERLKRVKAGEAKPVVYPHPNPDEVHEMVRVGHAEFSHYGDLVLMADVAMATLPRIAELSLKAARWDECERLAERFTGATGATFWELQPQQGESFAAAIDASIAERAAIEADSQGEGQTNEPHDRQSTEEEAGAANRSGTRAVPSRHGQVVVLTE